MTNNYLEILKDQLKSYYTFSDWIEYKINGIDTGNVNTNGFINTKLVQTFMTFNACYINIILC